MAPVQTGFRRPSAPHWQAHGRTQSLPLGVLPVGGGGHFLGVSPLGYMDKHLYVPSMTQLS